LRLRFFDLPGYHSCVELKDKSHDIGIGSACQEESDIVAIVNTFRGNFETVRCIFAE
jgi:hypothetical protein